jgi:hypothetical protein
MPDGSIEDLTDQVKGFERAGRGRAEWLRQQKQARIEQRDSYTICRYLITMSEVLEESDWPGMHIPVVPVIGEEVRVGRDVYRHGIVRYARDLAADGKLLRLGRNGGDRAAAEGAMARDEEAVSGQLRPLGNGQHRGASVP